MSRDRLRASDKERVRFRRDAIVPQDGAYVSQDIIAEVEECGFGHDVG